MTYGHLEALQVKSFDEPLLERRERGVRDGRKDSALGVDQRHFLDLDSVVRVFTMLRSIPFWARVRRSRELRSRARTQ